MRKRPVLTFFILALLISWAGWIPFSASQAGLLNIKIPAELIWLSEFGPTFSALIITHYFYGKTGLKDIKKRLFLWKVNYKWYLFAILITPVFILISIGIDGLLFGTSYDFSMLNNWDSNFIKRTEAFVPSIGIITNLVLLMKKGGFTTGIIFLILALTNGGLSEEIGWRGFGLEEFQKRPFNIFYSSVFIAILWAIWHTGTLFWQTIMKSNLIDGLSFSLTYLLQYFILVFPLSIIYTVLYNGTKGSILLSIILHAFYNISISLFATAFPDFPMLTFVICIFIFSIILILTLWKNGKYNKLIKLQNNYPSI